MATAEPIKNQEQPDDGGTEVVEVEYIFYTHYILYTLQGTSIFVLHSMYMFS